MSSDWVTLRSFDFPAQAELAKLHLAEAGINCRLLNSEIVGMNPLLGNAIGYIPLLVHEDDFEAAEQVLLKMGLQHGNCQNCGEPTKDVGPCPMCGGLNGDPESLENDLAGEGDDEDDPADEESATLDGLRKWRRPVILLFLAPALISIALAALALLGGVLSLLLPRN